MTKDKALRLALEALEFDSFYATGKQEAITAIKAALEANDEPIGWKLMPRDATNAMLKAMDECAIEGYDERLPAGIASSVYMAAWDAMPQQKKISQKPLSLEWDEVFDAAASAYCRSEASRKALRLCFQSREQTSKISIGWTANELMDFAKTIAYICVTEKTNEFNPDWDAMAVMVEEQQRMAKRIEELEAKSEPVGEVLNERGEVDYISYVPPVGTALYTTPPQRKPLTEQQIKEALADMSALQMPLNKLIPAIARAIEAAHGIKGEA